MDEGRSVGHAFVSYVREDSLKVDRLQRVLESAGVRVWRDTAEVWPGQDWRDRIREAITSDALVFLACFSRNSVDQEKSYQNEELVLAIEQLRLRRPGVPWLIPVRFDDCVIPDLNLGGGRTLNSIQRADLFGYSYDQAAERLVTVVQGILGSRSGASSAAGKAKPAAAVTLGERLTRAAYWAVLSFFFVTAVVLTRADQPELTPILHFPSWVSAVAFSPDGRLLACGTGDGDNRVTLWDVANPARPGLLSTLVGYDRTVRTVVFSPNGHILATASWDGTVALWDVAKPAQPTRIDTLDVSNDMVQALAFSPDGKMLAAGDSDQKVFLWNVTDPARPISIGHPLMGHAGFVRDAVFSPDGHILATANGNHLVILWNVTNPARPTVAGRLDSYSGFESGAVFSPDGEFLAASSTNGTVMLWNVAKPSKPIFVTTFQAFTGDWVMGEAYSPDGRILATANRPDSAVLWDVSDPTHPRQDIVIPIRGGQYRYAEAVTFSPNGLWLAIASYNHTVSIWRLPS